MKEYPEICDFCHVGSVIEKRLTYTERFQEELIIIADIPTKICNYCGEKRYNAFIMNTLHRLLWTNLNMTKQKRNGPAHYTYPTNPQARLTKGQVPRDEN